LSEIRTGNTDALILCGGLGTRFSVVREDIPKAMAPVQGTPFIDLLLDDLIAKGFRRIILATGHLGDLLNQHVSQRTGAEYVVSCEPKPLGTGGAIKFAETHFQSDTVLVMNGDSKIECNLSDFLISHMKNQADMTVLVSKVVGGTEYGSVEINNNDRIVNFTEKPVAIKPSIVNAGVYLINKGLLKSLRKNHNYSLEEDCLPTWIHSKNIFGYITEAIFQDIGTPERYNSFCKDV